MFTLVGAEYYLNLSSPNLQKCTKQFKWQLSAHERNNFFTFSNPNVSLRKRQGWKWKQKKIQNRRQDNTWEQEQIDNTMHFS